MSEENVVAEAVQRDPYGERIITEQIAQPKVTVGFERTVKIRDYEPMKASVYIQADVPIGYTAKELEQGLRDAFFQAKAQVLEQLGLEFEISEHGVVMELLTKAFGPVEMVQGATAQLQDNASAQPTMNSDTITCERDRSHKVYDNRPKKAAGEYKPSAPDAKCSQCDWKLWPAKK